MGNQENVGKKFNGYWFPINSLEPPPDKYYQDLREREKGITFTYYPLYQNQEKENQPLPRLQLRKDLGGKKGSQLPEELRSLGMEQCIEM